MQSKEKNFKVLWESGQPKQTFTLPAKPGVRNGQFTRSDHDTLAKSMTFQQIMNASKFVENDEMRRKHRWKEMRNFWLIVSQPPYARRSVENALFLNHNHKITGHHFIMSLMNEFQFDNKLHFDAHLQYIYWSFDGGREDCVDWRDFLATFFIMKYFRLIKERTLELIMLIFDIYTTGDRDGRALKKSEYVLHNADGFIRRIFTLPCITDSEFYAVGLMLADLEGILLAEHNNCIKHRDFERLMTGYNPQLLNAFSRMTWDRLSTDMRLTVLDEAQLHHRDNAEAILYRYKLSLALRMNHRNICRAAFIEWKLMMLRESGVRLFVNKVLYRRRMRFVKWWHFYTARQQVRRRRRMLAEVIGSYAVKSRCFARIKLFNYNNTRLKRLVGSFDTKGRREKLGGTHLREFRRLLLLRLFYHRWWNQCVEEINDEACRRHNHQRLLKRALLPWYRYAHEKAVQTRNELVVAENKVHFDRMMAEADKDIQDLMELEQQRNERIQAAENAVKENERQTRLNQAKARAQKEKNEERNLLLSIQREARGKRIARDMKVLKSQFKKLWEGKKNMILEKAKMRVDAYVANPSNQLAIEMKFQVLKREFHQPPTPETVEREKMLSSPKNILMLYIAAKLSATQLQLSEVIPQFDKHNKGYLTYTEFSDMIRFVGASLNPAQIASAIRDIDMDGDGFVELKELQQSMAEIKTMGVPGSPWKLYIDPAEDVICYHNMVTGDRIYEYQMTDKKLREINIANMYGEAEDAALQQVREQKKVEFDVELKSYMARRMQYMYRLWRARRRRAAQIWRLDKRELKVKTDLQRQCVRFMERTFIGFRCREVFKKQLRLTIEKVWDIETGTLFWHNHFTKVSSWEMPRLLRRYGDVTSPLPWVPVPKAVASSGKYTLGSGGAAAAEEETLYRIHYWHVPARKDLPRKPDGLPLCTTCCRNLAVHSCHTCGGVNYCHTCLRESHSNPMGFLQRTKAKKSQYSDPVFLEKLAKSRHVYTPAKPLRCQMCSATHICAGIHCNTCGKDLCRPCHRRIHTHSSKEKHEFYDV